MLTTPEFIIALAPLVIGLVTARLLPVDLLKFVTVYIILGGVSILLTSFLLPSVNILFPIIGVVAGLVVFLILTALLGNKISATNYASILMAMGLYPWYAGVVPAIAFVLGSFLFLGLHSAIRAKLAFNGTGMRFQNFERARKKMSEDEFKTFSKKASVIFAIPFILAALFSIVFV